MSADRRFAAIDQLRSPSERGERAQKVRFVGTFPRKIGSNGRIGVPLEFVEKMTQREMVYFRLVEHQGGSYASMVDESLLLGAAHGTFANIVKCRLSSDNRIFVKSQMLTHLGVGKGDAVEMVGHGEYFVIRKVGVNLGMNA